MLEGKCLLSHSQHESGGQETGEEDFWLFWIHTAPRQNDLATLEAGHVGRLLLSADWERLRVRGWV